MEETIKFSELGKHNFFSWAVLTVLTQDIIKLSEEKEKRELSVTLHLNGVPVSFRHFISRVEEAYKSAVEHAANDKANDIINEEVEPLLGLIREARAELRIKLEARGLRIPE